MYRPPSSKAIWADRFALQIEKSRLLKDGIYIARDLNIDFKNADMTNNKWKKVTETHDLCQVREMRQKLNNAAIALC